MGKTSVVGHGRTSFCGVLLALAATFATGCNNEDGPMSTALVDNVHRGPRHDGDDDNHPPASPPTPAECQVYGIGDMAGEESEGFSANLRQTTSALLEPSRSLDDADGIAEHPSTRILYVIADDHERRSRRAHAPHPGEWSETALYTVDSVTGKHAEVGDTGLSRLHGLNFRATDETLWTWVKAKGLAQIDITTGHATLVYKSHLPVTAFAWNHAGTQVYVAEGTKLSLFEPGTGVVTPLPGELPTDTVSLHTRADDRLFGMIGKPIPDDDGADDDGAHTGAHRCRHFGHDHHHPHHGSPEALLMRFFLHDPPAGETVATYDVPVPEGEHSFGEQDKRPIKHFTGHTWRNACGSPVPGGPTELISNVALDPSEVCLGESVFVQVTAAHPDNPSFGVDVTINGVPGKERYIQFPTVPPEAFVPGPRTITVTAATTDGYFDQKSTTVNVVDCHLPVPPPVVMVAANPYAESTADFTVTVGALPDATYHWDFGDGTTKDTTVPGVSHSYADKLARDQQYTVFQTKLTMHKSTTDLTTKKTVTMSNPYALARVRGHIRPPVRGTTSLTDSGSGLSGQFKVKNFEDSAISFDSRRLQYRYCDEDVAPALQPAESFSLSVAAGAEAPVTVSLAAVPAEVCGVAVHLSGTSSGGLPILSSAYLDIPSRATRVKMTNQHLVDRLNQLKENHELRDPNRVTDADLHQLVLEHKLDPSDLAEPTGPAFRRTAGTVELDGPCDPGAMDPDKKLECVPSGEWSERGALVENAEKGDLILVEACSFIGGLFDQLHPVQRYTHEAIMTRNYSHLSQSTAAEDRPQDEDNFDGYDGVKTDVMKYEWPGVLRDQTVSEAFHGIHMTDPEGKDRFLDEFSPNAVHCSSDTMLGPPLVVRPPIGSPSEVRAKLYDAADIAKTYEGHYRFYAYTEANISLDTFWDQAGHGPATVSAQFIWTVLHLAQQAQIQRGDAPLILEGPHLEDKDVNGLAMLHFGGAQVDVNTMDGLYLYTEDERKDAAQWMYDYVHDKVLGIAGVGGQFLTDAPSDFANQMVNCFVWDFCGNLDTGTICRLSEGARPEGFDSQCCSNPYAENGEVRLGCRSHDVSYWEDPRAGHAVSPDNFMFWDQPAGTPGAEDGENGVYGDFAILTYRENDRVQLYHWAPRNGRAALEGRVVEEGKQACIDTVECAMGDVCDNRACKHACAADDDCADVGGTCLDGFCARPVEGAVVYYEQAAPDTLRTTDADGNFAAYEDIPVSGKETEIRAQLVTDPDPNVQGDETTILGKTQFVLMDQDVQEVTIILRPTDPTFRFVTVKGRAHMVDCDCANPNDVKDRDFMITCRVDPSQPEDGSISISQDEICDDEIGVSITGKCLLLAGNQDRAVHIQGDVRLYEGESGTCGGSEQEDHFFFEATIPPYELLTPGTKTKVGMDNGLHHGDVCVYGFVPASCDDDVYNLGNTSGINDIQEF